MRTLPIPRKKGTNSRQHKREYVYDPSFDAPGAGATILAQMPGTEGWASVPGWLDFNDDSSPASSCDDTPLLSAEQEVHLFRKMNYLMHRAGKLRASNIDEFERLRQEALAVKNQLIRSNLRLVLALARRRAGQQSSFSDLVSDGNMALIRAVEKFDFARGFRFSTYATRAIVRAFARSVPREQGHRYPLVTGHQQILEATTQDWDDEEPDESASDPRRRWGAVEVMFGRLNGRERQVLVSRYGLEGADVQTLAQLGRTLGVTRERVRQIELQAHKKLRKLVFEEYYRSKESCS
jgi:RNA polymerase primary sigma factor